MGFLGKLASGVIRGTVGTAVSVVADTVTLGGQLTDRDEPYTASTIKKAVEDVSESLDDLGDGDVL